MADCEFLCTVWNIQARKDRCYIYMSPSRISMMFTTTGSILDMQATDPILFAEVPVPSF